MEGDTIDDLRQRILLKMGLQAVTPRDCKWMAAEIRRCVNRHISTTTVKRIFGFAEKKNNFSKYTIITLNEYAVGVGNDQSCEEVVNNSCLKPIKALYLSTSKSCLTMDLLSFITEDRSRVSEVDDISLCLHPEQLVITAIKILMKDNLSSLTIYEAGNCFGRVYTNELKQFVNWGDKNDPLIFHRLNFDLFTALTIMMREG